MRNFAKYFDGVFCLSLPSSNDRRRFMQKQFRTVGIERYEFFDATGGDDPVVEDLYESGKVARYPPCFRCGELTCGSDDCNNVLIPAQVATFVSFMNLWRHILDAQIETTLIVEDDMVFVDYAPRIAEVILQRRLLDQVGIRREEPVLLRLGWAAGSDHRATGRIEFKPDHIKMSNPCHALNRAMAAKLLDAFKTVDTTVDIFTHKRVGPTVANFTLFPPLASELSWSLGAVASLIHPKEKRVAYLKKHHPERHDEIAATIEALRHHVKHILYRPLLAVGHPRCGTRYMSELLTACGLDVGHERMGEHGISSWRFAVEDDRESSALDPLSSSRKNTHFGNVVQFVRDPRTAIPSIVRENQRSEKSYAFRRKHIRGVFDVDLDAARSGVEKAVLSYVYWNKIIERQQVNLRVRIEEGEAALHDFLKERQLLKDVGTTPAPPKTVSARKSDEGVFADKPSLSEADWDAVGDEPRQAVNEMCRRYGYPELFG